MNGQTCSGCRWPPVVHNGDDQDCAQPITLGSRWCGEWQAATPVGVDAAAMAMARQALAGDGEAARALADKLFGG